MSSYQTIKLTRFSPTIDAVTKHAWALTIVAEGINMPSDIFVYRVESAESSGDTFRCIASVNDLYEFPRIRAPYTEGDNQIPYYRRSQVELICRNPVDAERVWEQIKEDVDDLIANYNATLSMQVVGYHEVSTDSTKQINDLPTMAQQRLIQLDYQPNGAIDINQNILEPLVYDVRGWLPISAIPGDFVDTVPTNAKFFYNITKHSDLAALFPLVEPYNKHMVYYEGNKLLLGKHYAITKDTIYWLDFTSGSETDYGILGNTPWNPDYIDRANKGIDEIDMSILIFSNN